MSRRVVVVDDTAFMRMVLRGILEEAGFEVVGEGQNGREAIDLYNRLSPDLMTMDITMPEMDGIAAVKQIRQSSPGAKIIMCSALGQKDMVVEAIQSGASDFIVKPFQKERVYEALNRVIC